MRFIVCLLICLAPASLVADVLILRNGERVEGDLIAVRSGVIEFQQRRGNDARTVRVNRDEVVRIELDDFDDGRENVGNSRSPGYGRLPDGGRSGMRERVVVVSANIDWTDTGIDVRAGQTIFIEATGEVRWGRGRQDGAEGESNSPYNAARPIPNRPAGALIGKVGTRSDDAFFIGNDRGGTRVRSSGRLYLGINDEYLQDNADSFRVVISY